MEKNPQDTRNNNIVIPDNQFNYNNLRLADPISVQGGSYFTKITNIVLFMKCKYFLNYKIYIYYSLLNSSIIYTLNF